MLLYSSALSLIMGADRPGATADAVFSFATQSSLCSSSTTFFTMTITIELPFWFAWLRSCGPCQPLKAHLQLRNDPRKTLVAGSTHLYWNPYVERHQRMICHSRRMSLQVQLNEVQQLEHRIIDVSVIRPDLGAFFLSRSQTQISGSICIPAGYMWRLQQHTPQSRV
jgi:hypothetical protein